MHQFFASMRLLSTQSIKDRTIETKRPRAAKKMITAAFDNRGTNVYQEARKRFNDSLKSIMSGYALISKTKIYEDEFCALM